MFSRQAHLGLKSLESRLPRDMAHGEREVCIRIKSSHKEFNQVFWMAQNPKKDSLKRELGHPDDAVG